jgi:hypothetical protein
MKAPPISEATLVVDVARSAMADPEAGIFGGASGVAELTWLVNHAEENPAATTSANKPLKKDLIERLRLGKTSRS